ncbi:MAG: hypothetical protein KAG94_03735 [Clostridiales bacterium]|nr:hypothetical protein [Clostridiales bacterium]
MIAYFYINKNKTKETSECGLKLSMYSDTEIIIDIFKKKAIMALLSPKDDLPKHNDNQYDCLKLELPNDKLYIAEKVYLELDNQELFLQSVIKATDYIVSMYRKPIFTITFTVIGDYISVLDRNRDIPILFDNSEEAYLKANMANLENQDDNFNDRALLGYFNNHPDYKKNDIGNKAENYEVFTDGKKTYLIRKVK